MGFINNTVPLVLTESGELLKKSADIVVCSYSNSEDLKLLVYILLLFVFLLFLIKYKKFFMNIFRNIQGKRGYVKILYQLPNRKIKELFIKVNKDNLFDFNKKTYTLEKMNDFILGYDKNNLPIFMYNHNFILPMKIEQKSVTKELRLSYEESTGNKLNDKQISALLLKVDATVLHTVYKRKLLSDLYSISAMDKEKMKWLMIIGGVVLLIIAYYTGLLDKLFELIGA